jgi:hypothetical protein
MAVTIRGSGQVPVQVVQGTTTTTTSTTSTTYVATNLTATITPTNAANKILVMVSCNGIVNNAGYAGYYTVYRDSTNIGGGTQSALNLIQDYYLLPITINYLDSPATTSAITYTLYIKVESGSTNNANTNRNINTITLMEISGA